MSEVQRVLKRAYWRLFLLDAIRHQIVALIAWLSAVIILIVVERAFGLQSTFDAWWRWMFWGGLAAAVAVGFAYTFIRSRRGMTVARTIDDRAGLHESISTAMSLEASKDPWAVAVIETAEARAKGVRVNQAIAFEIPRYWPVPIALGVVAVLFWARFPMLDVLGVRKQEVAQQEKQAQIQAVREDVREREAKVKALLDKARLDFEDGAGDTPGAEARAQAEQDPDAIRRQAIRNLTSLTEKIQAAQKGEKAQQSEAIREAMRQMKQPGPGPLDEFSRALARGEFAKAQEKLGEAAKAMANGDMSPEHQAKAKAQVENMAKQLDQLAKNQDKLAQKLEAAGLDKKSAQEMAQQAAKADPAALQEKLDQMKNLSESQKQQMSEMMNAASKAQQDMSQMSQCMGRMAQGMSQQGFDQAGAESLDQLSEQLSQLDQIESDMNNLDAALDEAKRQLAEMGRQAMGNSPEDGESCGGSGQMAGKGQGEGKGSGTGQGEGEGGEGEGQYAQGEGKGMGQGTGGPGQGNSARSPDAVASDFTYEKTKANVRTGAGPIIGTRLVQGTQVKGESVQQFENAVSSGRAAAAEGMDTMQIPREYHDAIKHYFGTLEAKVKKQPDAAPAAPAPTPAGSPK